MRRCAGSRSCGRIGPCEVVAGVCGLATGGSGPARASSGRWECSKTAPQMQEVLERDLQAKVSRNRRERKGAHRSCGASGAAPMRRSSRWPMEAQADLVVVGTHQWHGLSRLRHGSISRGILHHAPMSVACVPTPAGGAMAGPRIRECRRVLACRRPRQQSMASPRLTPIRSCSRRHGASRAQRRALPAAESDDRRRLPGLSHGEGTRQRFAEAEDGLRALTPPEAEARGITTEVEVHRKM